MSISNNLCAHLSQILKPYFEQPIWVAFSGGLDSTVLAEAMSQLSTCYQLNVTLLHINHQLQETSSQWAQHCQHMARKWKFPCECVTLTTRPEGASTENWARQQRRQIFADKLNEGGVVITAHHQDDQAETLLFRLLRGTGPDGLAAMRVCSPLAKGQIVRPFLNVARETLEAYAQEHQLPWVEDASNQDTVFARNYLRHNVMPVLEQQWPRAKEALSRCADLCAEQRDVLDSYLADEIQHLQQGKPPNQLPLAPWHVLPKSKQHLVLRYWLYQQTGFYLTQKQLRHVIRDVIGAQEDADPIYPIGQMQCRRYQNVLYLISSLTKIDPNWSHAWNGKQGLVVPGWQRPLTKTLLQHQGVRCDEVDWSKVIVRFRQVGERVSIKGHTQTQALKKILQDQKVPPWLRDQVPLVFEGDVLLSIIDFYDW